MASEQADVLVIGAGPTGLALALQAGDHGAGVRIVERRAESFRPSRAMVMHPRTLELLRPHGVTDALLERGDPAAAIQLHLGSRVARVRAADLDLAGTEFPHFLLIRQADVEAVLADALADRGIAVQRGCELTALDRRGEHAILSRAGNQERAPFGHLVGCDGIDSTVRRLAGIGWRGGRYREEVLLADLELESALDSDASHAFAAHAGVLFLFGKGETASWRLLATRTASRPPDERCPPTGAALQAILDDAGVPATLTAVGWSARISPEHRLASGYRRGRLFLAGDAAHCHSPAAAQGMNTGIQDALNLGWKLAVSARSPATAGQDGPLLDSYEIERRAVARQVITLTSVVFWAEASAHPAAGFLRAVLAPVAAPALPLVLRQRWLLALALRPLAQFQVRYRRSPLSVEAAPGRRGPRAGDRLPDATVTVHGRPRRLHELVARPGFSLLLQRDALPGGDAERLSRRWSSQQLHVHRVTSWAGAGAILVRPDGYLGLRTDAAEEAQLRSWFGLLGADG